MKNYWQRVEGGMSLMEEKISKFHSPGQPSGEACLHNNRFYQLAQYAEPRIEIQQHCSSYQLDTGLRSDQP